MADYDRPYFDEHIWGWHQASFSAIASFVRQGLRGSSGLVILDMGCGDGIYGPALRPYADWLAGIDGSQAGVAKARTRGCYDELRCADITSVEAADGLLRRAGFDVVFSTEFIEHVERYQDVLAFCRTILRPQGRVLLTTTMYYHYFFHGLILQRSALNWSGLADYVGGFWSEERRKRFVKRFWEYTGGHYYGFSRRMLVQALQEAGFELQDFRWFYSGEVVPTHSLSQNTARFAHRGLHVAAMAKLALASARLVNRGVAGLGLPGANCLVIARAR